MAIRGFGATLTGATSGALGKLNNIVVAGVSREIIDLTDSDTGSGVAADMFREKIGVFADAGEITCECCIDNASGSTMNDINDALLSAVAEVWTIAFSDTATWACEGLISGYSINNPVMPDEKVTVSVTITLTGKPTYTDLV